MVGLPPNVPEEYVMNKEVRAVEHTDANTMNLRIAGARVVGEHDDGTLEIVVLGIKPVHLNSKAMEAIQKDLEDQGVKHKDANRMMDAMADGLHQECISQILKDRVTG